MWGMINIDVRKYGVQLLSRKVLCFAARFDEQNERNFKFNPNAFQTLKCSNSRLISHT